MFEPMLAFRHKIQNPSAAPIREMKNQTASLFIETRLIPYPAAEATPNGNLNSNTSASNASTDS